MVSQELLISISHHHNDISSIVYSGNKTFYDKSDCTLQVVAKTLGMPTNCLAMAPVEALVPLQWRNQIYETVANHYWANKTSVSVGIPSTMIGSYLVGYDIYHRYYGNSLYLVQVLQKSVIRLGMDVMAFRYKSTMQESKLCQTIMMVDMT
jgi:hypothetical protein